MSETLSSLTRALTVLDHFLVEPHNFSLAQLAQKTGLAKPTIHRMCATLVEAGYLGRDFDSVRYTLGPKLFRFSAVFDDAEQSGTIIRAKMRQIQETTKETVTLYRLDGFNRRADLRVESSRSLKHTVSIGSLLPLHAGAAGIVILAHAEADFVDRYLTEAPGARHIERETLLQRLVEVRNRGFATTLGERDGDLGAAAVPLFCGDGKITGALAISGPVGRVGRMDMDETRNLLTQAASVVQRALARFSC